MPLYIAKSGELEGCHACLTDSQRKDRATQLLIKYKNGALVTQLHYIAMTMIAAMTLTNTQVARAVKIMTKAASELTTDGLVETTVRSSYCCGAACVSSCGAHIVVELWNCGAHIVVEL